MINTTSIISVHTCNQTGNQIIISNSVVNSPIWVCFKALELNLLNEENTDYYLLGSNIYCKKNENSFYVYEYLWKVKESVKIFEIELASLTEQHLHDLTNAILACVINLTEENKEYVSESLTFIHQKSYISVYTKTRYIQIPLYTNAEIEKIENKKELTEYDNAVVF